MKHFKLIALLSAFVLISAVAWAGNTPEYDAVGQDDQNIYSQFNFATYGVVNAHVRQGPLEADSDFTGYPRPWNEDFDTNAGQVKASPCLGNDAYLTDVWNQGTYEWWIVLQMKPESDLNINIYDCVLKHNTDDIFFYADQTGRYRQPWGELVFNPLYNPLIAAAAYPGPYATAAFTAPFTLDARTLPGLVPVALDGVSYSSKGHWDEGILVAMPKTGDTNASGQLMYNLKQGDVIHVTVEIPSDTNTVDVWYGPDSVIIKYIGIINTEFFASLGVD